MSHDIVDSMPSTKTELRAAILAARRAVPVDLRRAESAALCQHLADLAQPGDTVCAYVPVGSEPGSPALLDVLVAGGARVLLPVARRDDAETPLPLNWGEYREGQLVEAGMGLREPRAPWLAPDAIRAASTILVPALATDRAGVRLGRGAGFYDRSLFMADPAARRIALVRDDELVGHLPGEPHDVPMTHAITPAFGLVGMAGPT